MTKKDYATIAEVLRESKRYYGAEDAVVAIANRLAIIMYKDNPRFDTKRFLDACGVIQ